jgi:high-affinity nickel-transport protein
MEVVSGAPPVGALALLVTALVLGLRQGTEWHHVVAITDITGALTVPAADDEAADKGRRWLRVNAAALALAAVYAGGYALVAAVLGVAALTLEASLPAWVSPAVERVMGGVLLTFGLWMLYALWRSWRGAPGARLATRGTLLLGGLRTVVRLWGRTRAALAGQTCGQGFHVHPVAEYQGYGPRAAFGLGVVHGLGAEAVPPLLLLASVGGAAGGAMGPGLLVTFLAGLVLANVALALVTSLGFLSAGRARGVYLAFGGASALFSVYIGSCALLAWPVGLPA